MKKFVGDLSLQDAELLERYVSRAKAVLEFAWGADHRSIDTGRGEVREH